MINNNSLVTIEYIEEDVTMEIELGHIKKIFPKKEILQGLYQYCTDVYIVLLDTETNLEAWIPWNRVNRINETEKL
jgi:hypothetical protein